MTAVPLLPHDADRDQWLARRREGVGASDIAAVMGVSPYESPFSLWWRKHLGWDLDPTPEMQTGAFLETAIADWFDMNETGDEFELHNGGLYASADRPWQLATPDRLIHAYGYCGGQCDDLFKLADGTVCQPCTTSHLTGVLECKWVAYSWDGWGDEDQVPVHYRAQVLWQMDVMETSHGIICALGPGGFRSYIVRRDEKDLTVMREAGRRFWDSLTAGTPPPIDDHTATLPMVRKLNATIEDREQEIPDGVATGWLRSKRFKDLADRVERFYTAKMRDHMGSAKTAVHAGRPIAARTTTDQLRRKAYR